MKEFFDNLFKYNDIVNDKIMDRLIKNEAQIDERTKATAAHIALVHQNWNNRILSLPAVQNFWQSLPLNEVAVILNDENRKSVDILESTELSRHIQYHNSKGAIFNNSICDILFHILNHSNYHRGQINMRLRQSNVEPIITDYIFYRR